MKPFSTRFLFVVWAVDSVAWMCLIVYILIHGSDPDTIKLSEDLGAVWGGTAAFLIGPAWRAIKPWPRRSKIYLFSGIAGAALIVGILLQIRSAQTSRLESLFAETRDVAAKGAPQKQLFMKLTREDTQSLPEYLQRCAQLEPVIKDYSASEQQMDNLLAQVQQEIGGLRPQGSYGGMLPMLSVMRKILAKDLEGAKSYKQEVEFAIQLPGIPEKDRVRFYNTNIEPVLEQEHQVALDEMAILKDAKERGVAMPDKMLQDAGLK